MRKTGIVWAMLLAFLPSLGMAAESQVDKLVAKLVQKGILTQEEATELKQEVALEAKQETGTAQQSVRSEVPEWVQNTKLTGDFRIRNQYEHRIGSTSSPNGRDRARIRARLGVETKINDEYKMAIGIATDGGAARSNNQTLDNTFGKGNAVLNYAYGQWVPNDKFTATAGQMKNPIWEPMEFLWDADITPTGGALEYNYKVNDHLALTAMGSGFVIREIALSNADPYMLVGQLGAKGKLLGEKADYRLVGTYQNVQNNTKGVFATAANNTTVTSGSTTQYKYRFNTPMVGAEFGLNDPLSKSFPLQVPRIALFGEYAQNPNPKDENVVWMGGVYVGHSKVAGKGAWKITGAYKSIGRDSWLDVLPDADFYGGGTDTQGYEALLEYGLAKNVTFAVDYYHTQRKSSLASPAQESLLQTDINLKF